MEAMDIVVVVMLVVVVGAAAALAAVEVTRRRLAAAPAEPAVPVEQVVQAALSSALSELRQHSAGQTRAALDYAAVVQREQLSDAASQVRAATSDELNAKKDVIDARLEQVRAEVAAGLGKLTEMVTTMATVSSEK